MNYFQPNSITNIIYDAADNSYVEDIIAKISSINPQALLIRIDNFSFNLLESILNLLKFSGIRCIDLKFNSNSELKLLKLVRLINEEKRIRFIEIFSSNWDRSSVKFNLEQVFTFYSKRMNPQEHCSIIDKSIFNTNLKFVTESMNFNNCLNGKLYISNTGLLKNCPFSKEVFGNILKDNLDFIDNSDNFQEFKDITKDMVEDCKVCEYRYICTDCRVYTKDNEKLGKPIYCKYNPHKGIWEN